jgi:hypothetical protein
LDVRPSWTPFDYEFLIIKVAGQPLCRFTVVLPIAA